MERNQAVLDHFGRRADTLFWGTAHQRYAAKLRDAIGSKRIVGIIGDYGCGKSTLVAEALRRMKRVEVIYVNHPERAKLKIAGILFAAIKHLSEEDPKRDTQSRNYQFSKLAGEMVYGKRHKIVIVIENAHRVTKDLILDLKDLRESARYHSFKHNSAHKPLFSALLIGQTGLKDKLEHFGEVWERSDTIELSQAAGWMTMGDRLTYLTEVYGPAIDEPTRRRLAAMYETPLSLDNAIGKLLAHCRDAGLPALDERTLTPDIADLIRGSGFNYSQIAVRAGLPKSTVSDYANNKGKDPEKEASIRSALDAMIAEQTAGRKAA